MSYTKTNTSKGEFSILTPSLKFELAMYNINECTERDKVSQIDEIINICQIVNEDNLFRISIWRDKSAVIKYEHFTV